MENEIHLCTNREIIGLPSEHASEGKQLYINAACGVLQDRLREVSVQLVSTPVDVWRGRKFTLRYGALASYDDTPELRGALYDANAAGEAAIQALTEDEAA